MNLKSLSNEALHSETLSAAAREKNATLVLLEFLEEVDSRRLYNERGYSSLWEYVHRGLGYSEASASERVSAVRLLRKVPEVREQIAESRLTLTSVAKLSSFVKRENCSLEKTTELLGEIEGKPTREVERVLATHQTIPMPAKPDLIRPTGPEITRVAFDADSEFMSLYEELRNLQGHRPGWTMKDQLKAAMKEVITRKKEFKPLRAGSKKSLSGPDESSPQAPERSSVSSETLEIEKPKVRAPEERAKSSDIFEGGEFTVRAPEVKPLRPKLQNTPSQTPRSSSLQKPISRYIPIPVRRVTLGRSGGRCEFVDPKTNRRCESRFALEFDHIYPYAKGGLATASNIRHLCASHNRFSAIREFGAEKVRQVQCTSVNKF